MTGQPAYGLIPAETVWYTSAVAGILFLVVIFFCIRFLGLYRKEKEEKQQLKALLENVNEGILLVNSSGVIINANPNAEKIFGYTRGELMLKELAVLVPTKYRATHLDLVEQYLINPYSRPMGNRIRGQRKGGEVFFVDVSLSHFTSRGKTTVIAFVMDASQRIRNEELLNSNLKRSESLYQAMASNFPDGIIGVMGKDMTWLLVDGKGLAELGLEKATLRGDHVFDDIHRTITNYAEGALRRVFAGELVSFDVIIQDKFYNVSSVPIYSKSEIHEILVVIKNVSTQKKIEQELVKTLQKEKELNTLKSRFVTMASHEFRTPLTTILSSTFLLENYPAERLSTERYKHLGRIKHAVHSLTELLNDFLSLGKLEEGKVEASLKPLKLKSFAEEILHEVSITKKEDQRIIFEFSGDDREVLMDGHLLRNILLNLLSNAIKYSPPTGAIGLTISLESRSLTLKVSDQGIGIPPEEQKHIFKRFFRAKNTAEVQGTGLGLNIVRRYVRLLKGRIEFNSRENKGTTFTVHVPLVAEK